jgi:FMN phosphatase YigB (HAD superfamily)
MWGGARTNVRAWMGALARAGHSIALPSNTPFDTTRLVGKNFHQLTTIDLVILSAVVHLVKSDPEIFHLCPERLRVRVSEDVFIDDNEEKYAAGRSLGVATIRFRSAAQPRSDLRSMGSHPLPS